MMSRDASYDTHPNSVTYTNLIFRNELAYIASIFRVACACEFIDTETALKFALSFSLSGAEKTDGKKLEGLRC